MMHRRSSQSGLDEPPATDLYQRHAPGIFAYLRRQTLSREDAEDVLLEVFLAAAERNQLAGLAAEEQLAWLRQVTRHKLADHFRQTNRRVMVDLDVVADTLYADDHHEPEQMALQHESERRLHAEISQLPSAQQEVLRLHFGEGLR